MTNPDNVGGLPELPAELLEILSDLDEGSVAHNQARCLIYEYARAYGELCRAAPAGGDWHAGYKAGYHDAKLGHDHSAPAGSGEVSDAIQFLRDCAANSGGVHITSERCRRAREILSLLSSEEPIRELLESCWLAIDSIQGGGGAKAELLRRIDAALLRKLPEVST